MKRRLLLVEDDEVFLRPLHRTLELQGLRGPARAERRGSARHPQVGGRGSGAHRPPPGRDGRRRAREAGQGRAPGPRGAGDDRLRHHRVGGRGDAPGGGGLSRQALRDGGAPARHPPGHRVPGAEVGQPPDHPAEPGAIHLQQYHRPERGHAGGLRPRPLRRRSRYHRADPWGDRGGEGAARPVDPLLRRAAASAPSSRSTARRSPRSCSSPSCSARAGGPSREPPSTGAGTSRWRAAAPCSSTRSGRCPCICRASCCGRSRRRR